MTYGLPPKGNTVNTSECIFHVTLGLFPSLVLMRIDQLDLNTKGLSIPL